MKKWSKRLVSALLMVVLMLTMFPFSLGVNGASSNIAYAVENGYIYFDPSTGTIVDCDQSVTKADIPAQIGGVWVKNIGDSAFAGCNKLKEIYTQTYISVIGNYAFNGCAKLEDVCIWGAVYAHKYRSVSSIESEIKNPASGSCYWIGHSAFKGCSSLGNISLFSGVTYLGACAFEQCSSLISVMLPDKLEVIKDYTFSECSSLSNVNIPDSVCKIETMAFHACFSLKTIEINDGVETIDRQVFSNCGIENLNIPNSIKRIELATFEFCYALRNVYISDGVEYIAEAAFRNSGVEKISIPSTVKDIGNYVFEYCNKLTDVFYSGTKEEWDKIAIGEGNSELKNATIHYNSAAPNDPGQSSDDIETVEEIHQFQNWDIFTNTVYFRDGTSYKLSDTYGSVNIEDLLDNWVVCTIRKDSSKGNYVTDMEKITSEIVVDITLDKSEIFYKDNDLSFDGENYEWKSFFEIPYHVTVENRLSHSVDAATLKAMQADDSPLNVEINDVSVIIPKEFNFGMFDGGKLDWDGPITLRANERWEENKNTYIRAEGDFSPSAKNSEYEMRLIVKTNSGDKADDAVFTVEYVDYMMESVETTAKKAANELKKVAGKAVFLSGEYSILRGEFGFTSKDVDSFKKSILIALASCTTPQDTLPDVVAKKYYDKFFSQYKLELTGSAQTVTLKYIFDTPKYGRLEVAVDCKLNRLSLSDTQFAMYGDIEYRVLNQVKNSSRIIPSSLKKGVLGAFGQCDIHDFADATYKLVEAELKQALYEPTAGNAVSYIANIVLSDTTKNIMKVLNVSADDLLWKMVTYATKSSCAACPIDLYVYDYNGALCGSIVNNRIIKESPGDFCLRVKDDVKYVTGLDAGYKIEYVATDNGKMNVEITEEIGINLPLRTISFHDVKLDKNAVYEQITPSDLMSSLQNYQLIVSQNGQQNKTIVPDEEEYVMEGHSDPSQGGSLPFTDVSASDWFYEKVQYVYENNIMVGVSNTKFDPYATLDRAQAVQILYNLESQPRVTGSTSFSDVAGHWAIQAIQWASEEGIAAGDGDGNFRPNDSITREEFAQMLYNYSRYKWYDISASGDLAKFQDADKVSDWGITAIKWANGHGLINGHDDGTIDPQGPAQRCQAASILCQYNQAIKKH